MRLSRTDLISHPRRFVFQNGSGELIHYERPDTEGPKLSDFVKTSIAKDEIQGLTEVLKKSNGIIGVVEKTRLLYIVDQTRVHVDRVNGLGDFMELEVRLESGLRFFVGTSCPSNFLKTWSLKFDITGRPR